MIRKMMFVAGAMCLVLAGISSGIKVDNNFIISSSPVSASSVGGPMVLDGMDPVCHSGGEGTWGYIAQVLKKIHDGANNINDSSIAVLGSNGTTNSCGGNWNTLLTEKYLGQFTTPPTVNFYNTASEVTTFFANINTSQPALIWIPDNWSRPPAVESVFTTNAEIIADFVNSGGGLFANMGTYGWLTALLPNAAYNNGGCNGGPEATTDGASDFTLTNSIVEACWHGFFTGDVGTLKTLVDYPYPSMSSPRVAVSVGGGSVSLPSSFTLAISPTSPNAGEDLTIVATAQTLAGVPQAGVSVTITVSAGPDAGQTFTATTDSTGVAVITVRTNSTGSATYTATAIVNGVSKTVSTTVSWNPPTTTSEPVVATSTTVVPETTIVASPPTTEESTTSTTLQETTTTLYQTVDGQMVESTTTTIHDHSTHSHGPKLPSTGSASGRYLWMSVFFIAIGLIMTERKKKIWKP